MTRPLYQAKQTSPEQICFKNASAVSLQKPSMWPGPNGRNTSVKALWSTQGLHVQFTMKDGFDRARDILSDKRSIENDDRVEVFIQPDAKKPSYFGYEMNQAGRILDYAAQFGPPAQLAFEWKGSANVTVMEEDQLVTLTATIPWSDLGLKSPSREGMRIGFYRGTPLQKTDGNIHFIWTCWVDPQKKDINFHCPETFADLQLI